MNKAVLFLIVGVVVTVQSFPQSGNPNQSSESDESNEDVADGKLHI